MTDIQANQATHQRPLSEIACDLIVIEHQLRHLRCWTPETTGAHLDAALSNVAAALDVLHAEYAHPTSPPPLARA